MITIFRTLLYVSAGLLIACSQPTRNFDQEAARLGYAKQLVKGKDFLHAVYSKGTPDPGDRIYVYLPGDGSPWINRSHISEDPTPLNPLTLKLMHKGPQPAIYLGRPCYHGLAQSPECDPRYWTSARYSITVVASMRAALHRLVGSYPDIKITLIGYSGGGTLAVLIAADFAEVDQLVTLAGNLDTDAWTEQHRYSPLVDSLNPALQAPLPASIRQRHFTGELDQNISVNIVQKFANNQHDAEVTIVPGFTHQCCWEQRWPQLLDLIQ
ncbi:MAG TPA: alpha/beta hydrolase [Gammaproteobacteria bacterium]|nr:alpha/beta hydrolase [Gammaproteobacteria bacterium]